MHLHSSLVLLKGHLKQNMHALKHNLHSSLVLLKVIKDDICICIATIYIPVWFYLRATFVLPVPILMNIYIPVWFYLRIFNSDERRRCNAIYIPVWFYLRSSSSPYFSSYSSYLHSSLVLLKGSRCRCGWCHLR